MRALHLGLAILCLLAWASAQFAGDYKRDSHLGFTIHQWIGLCFVAVLGVRLVYGIVGPTAVRFATWYPLRALNLRCALDDVLRLVCLQNVERRPHEGIAGIVQFLGLLAFAGIAATGVGLEIFLEPGVRASGWVHTLKELHEGAETIIPAYLALHVGGVMVHALFGQHLWRSMFFLRDKSAR